MSEHQSIYRPIGTALRQEQLFRNGTGRKQATKNLPNSLKQKLFLFIHKL